MDAGVAATRSADLITLTATITGGDGDTEHGNRRSDGAV
jgi:hypothetical protein